MTHSSWASAQQAKFEFAAAGEFKDGYDQVNDEPALVLYYGYDDVLVIEGSAEELRSLLQVALKALDGGNHEQEG